jgi:hypothetical protein
MNVALGGPRHIVHRIFHVDAVFTSDETSVDARTPTAKDVWSIDEAHARIQEHYGVDVRRELRIWRNPEQIARSK